MARGGLQVVIFRVALQSAAPFGLQRNQRLANPQAGEMKGPVLHQGVSFWRSPQCQCRAQIGRQGLQRVQVIGHRPTRVFALQVFRCQNFAFNPIAPSSQIGQHRLG